MSAMPSAHLDAVGLARVIHGATAVRMAPAVFRVEGPGAVACLQGLVTNDVERPGSGTLTYNALLTPKGMIVLDLWALRDADGFTLVADAAAREEALALFRKTLPPRLARLIDLTGTWEALWVIGGGSAEHLATAGLPSPAPGRLEPMPGGGWLAAGTEPAWFRALLAAPAEALDPVHGNLREAGVVEGAAGDIVAARVLAGWPALGAEILEKTLPQEVRFDEAGGVSYTKGCYLGQETVARVHFRGHPNRELRGLEWEGLPSLAGDSVELDGREVGTIRSRLELPGRRLALAVLRREVEIGAVVSAGGHPASVVALPFHPGPRAA